MQPMGGNSQIIQLCSKDVLTHHNVVGCQYTCPTGPQADENSQVMLVHCWRQILPILVELLQLLFQTTILQHLRLVRFQVQESPTQAHSHPLIVIEMNKDKCSVNLCDESLVSSLLFCPELNL